jgi:HK97 family phage prohead protease
MRNVEFRTFTAEVRAEGTASAPVVKGYAVKWMRRSKPIWTRAGSSFIERCSKGCFARALATQDQISTIEHNNAQIVGRKSAGTLRCFEDENGLYTETNLDPSVTYAADLYRNVKNGNIRNMSFTFSTPEDGEGEEWDWDTDENGERCRLRTLRNCDTLSEVSYVANPAYPDSSADARSLATVFFPNGSEFIEARSAGGIIIPKQVNEVEARRLRIQRVKSLL